MESLKQLFKTLLFVIGSILLVAGGMCSIYSLHDRYGALLLPGALVVVLVGYFLISLSGSPFTQADDIQRNDTKANALKTGIITGIIWFIAAAITVAVAVAALSRL